MCSAILKHKPDVVITEKGVADLTQHFLMSKGNVSIIRRVRKTDNNRIARVTGATIVHRPEDITEEDIGKDCGLFEVGKIGDDYFTYFTKCKSPSACTILFRGGSKDVLNEMERNFHDAIGVARNIFKDPTLIPGGGAIEMEVSSRLAKKAKEVEGIEQLPYKARKTPVALLTVFSGPRLRNHPAHAHRELRPGRDPHDHRAPPEALLQGRALLGYRRQLREDLRHAKGRRLWGLGALGGQGPEL